MIDETTQRENENEENLSQQSTGGDLKDSAHDEERMQPEEVILDLPDVSDIPGQENILPPQMDSFADTTISSDDEEGAGLFEEDNDPHEEDADLVMGTDADVSDEEKKTLEQAAEDMPLGDDTRLRAAELDSEDFEGDPLNESSLADDVSGSDLDTSGVDGDDPMESIGEEDEENNTYSLGSDSNDNMNEGTP